MKIEEIVYFCVDKNQKIVSNPYWTKHEAILHMEETEFPEPWISLYKEGYRVYKRSIFRNPNWK